jgi:hypothetical protein
MKTKSRRRDWTAYQGLNPDGYPPYMFYKIFIKEVTNVTR